MNWIHKIRANKWGLAGIVLLANIAFFAIMAAVLPMAYEENDDIVMAMIANGSYSGMPDCHLVFINVLYGYVMTCLYGWTTAVEWYTLSFAVLHIISMTVLVYCLMTKSNRSRWERILWLIVLYAIWARIIGAFQFTTTAGLVCLAGCMLLLRERWQMRWAGVALVIIGALIRYMAAGLIGLLMAPIILYTYRNEWRKYIPVAVMMLAVVGCRIANQKIYDRDAEWRYYRSYNQLRAQLNDNPNAYTVQPEQLPAGVDSTDYQMLLRFIPDPEQIDLETIRTLRRTVGDVPFRQQMTNLHRMNRYAVELCILMVLLVMMILTTGNKSKYIFLILYTLFVMALIIHVSLDGFLKNRVFLCILLPILMTDYMLLPKTTGRKRQWGIGIAMVALTGWYCYQTNQQQISVRNHRYVWTQTQQPLLTYVPNDAYVITIGTSMMMQATDPWHIWPYEFRKYTLGWMTYNPLNADYGHSYRVLSGEKVYVFTSGDYEKENSPLHRVCGQIEKHYGYTTEIEEIARNDRHALVQLSASK